MIDLSEDEMDRIHALAAELADKIHATLFLAHGLNRSAPASRCTPGDLALGMRIAEASAQRINELNAILGKAISRSNAAPTALRMPNRCNCGARARLSG